MSFCDVFLANHDPSPSGPGSLQHFPAFLSTMVNALCQKSSFTSDFMVEHLAEPLAGHVALKTRLQSKCQPSNLSIHLSGTVRGSAKLLQWFARTLLHLLSQGRQSKDPYKTVISSFLVPLMSQLPSLPDPLHPMLPMVEENSHLSAGLHQLIAEAIHWHHQWTHRW